MYWGFGWGGLQIVMVVILETQMANKMSPLKRNTKDNVNILDGAQNPEWESK